jgi:hypothetical protein
MVKVRVLVMIGINESEQTELKIDGENKPVV